MKWWNSLTAPTEDTITQEIVQARRSTAAKAGKKNGAGKNKDGDSTSSEEDEANAKNEVNVAGFNESRTTDKILPMLCSDKIFVCYLLSWSCYYSCLIIA